MLFCAPAALRTSLQETLLRLQTFQCFSRRRLAWRTCEISSARWSVKVKGWFFSSLSFMSIRHQREADVVQQSSSDALDTSVKTLALLQTLNANENKVKELIGDLKNT